MKKYKLSSNRAEGKKGNPWDYFVIPPYFSELDLMESRQSRVIEGGRGSGKTMLLKYLSFGSQFDSNKNYIDDKSIEHIGLYFRADSHFCSSMKGRGVSDSEWKVPFEHHLAISLSAELLKALDSVAVSNCECLNKSQLEAVDFWDLEPYGLPSTYVDLKKRLELLKVEFEFWVRNLGNDKPKFLPCRDLLTRIIRRVKENVTEFTDAVVYSYIDEYENLQEYQQVILNDLIKFGAEPLVFHIALKKNAMTTRKTGGQDYLSEENDYSVINLEESLTEQQFMLFAGEILIKELVTQGYKPSNDRLLKLANGYLTDITKIDERKKDSYKKMVLGEVSNILPQMTHDELADLVFEDRTIRNKLVSRFKNVLTKIGKSAKLKDIFDENHKQAMIILPPVLSRKSGQDRILEDLKEYKTTGNDTFKELIKNNFIGSYLQLYRTHDRPCPFYSGYRAFAKMSSLNLRHFILLAQRSMQLRQETKGIDNSHGVDYLNQTIAARHVSGKLLEEIKSFGKYGYLMHSFVQRVGTILALSHDRITQSEPEQTHFTFRKSENLIGDEEFDKLLKELEKFNVFKINRVATKKKDSEDFDHEEFILNPIYSPSFKISYRKNRCLEIKSHEMEIIYKGGDKEFKRQLSVYKQKFEVLSDEVHQPGLFG